MFSSLQKRLGELRRAGVRAFVWKWWRFVRPVPGWFDRYRLAKSGTTVWSVPDAPPETPKLVPWPLEWFPHRRLLPSDTDEGDIQRQFVFTEPFCVDSGLVVPKGLGVLCCRCGVPLHQDYAYPALGAPSFDAPYCRRCRFPMLLVK